MDSTYLTLNQRSSSTPIITLRQKDILSHEKMEPRASLCYLLNMLTTSERKNLIALHNKKERQTRGLFLVEGVKLVDELLQSDWIVERIVALEPWNHPLSSKAPLARVPDHELQRVSAMESPNQVLAVARIPPLAPAPAPDGLVLALAGVRDPGNMGTIIRIADWFGVSRIVCSPDCADPFNPKVVQASMGSLFRLPIHRQDLAPYLAHSSPHATVFATSADGGENLFVLQPQEPAIVVLGSEGQGIPPNLLPLIGRRLTIPRVGRAESLNVATATAILCAEWKRTTLLQ